MNLPAAIEQQQWLAHLALEFGARGGRTVLDRCRHHGPLRVQRPFHPEGAPSHVYLLHPPGGVVGGDQLDIEVRVGDEAHAVLTTPASNKFYRSDGRSAGQRQRLQLDPCARLEWLPQDSIVFDGAVAQLHTEIRLAPGARFIGWEVCTLGRPACGEAFCNGSLQQRLEMWRGDVPLLIERASFQGGSPMLRSPWGLQRYPSYATAVATPADQHTVAAARAALADPGGDCRIAFTLKGDVLIARALASQSQILHRTLTALWQAIRPAVMDRAPCMPRIWNT